LLDSSHLLLIAALGCFFALGLQAFKGALKGVNGRLSSREALGVCRFPGFLFRTSQRLVNRTESALKTRIRFSG
jgi:hypothetical protein